MNISPNEAEEALAAIQKMTQRTRHSLANSGAYVFLIATGIVWLVGFVSTQFLPAQIIGYIWLGVSLLGSVVATLIGSRMGRRVRGPATSVIGKRIATFWLLLILYGIAAVAVARPTEGKQLTMFIILLTMIGQTAMGLVYSFSSSWWALPISALALAGYFWLPEFFYLWMGVLGGGGMIALGLYIRSRW